MAQKVAEQGEECGKDIVAEAWAIDTMISINLERDWIKDLEYNRSDHLESKKLMLTLSKKFLRIFQVVI